MLTRLLRSFLRPYIRQVAIVVILLVAQTIGNLYLPNLNADIINNGVEKGDIHYIFTTGGIMLAIALAVGVLAIVAVYWASRVAMGAGADMRAAVFTGVQSFSAREVNRFGTPSLITRNTNDIQQIQLFLQMGLTLMVIAPIMCVGGMIMAVKEGAVLSLLLVVAVPVMAVVIGAMLITVVPQFRVMQVKIDRINQVLREQITGVRVIRAFVRTRPEAQRFGEANADLTATALRVNRVFALAMPALMAISTALMVLANLAIFWRISGRQQRIGYALFGDLVRWSTPEWLIWVLLVTGFGVFIPIPVMSTIALNCFVCLAAVYFCQGLAIMAFYFRLLAMPSLARVLIYFITIVQPVLAVLVCTAGILDLWIDFRRLKPPSPEARNLGDFL